MNIKVGFVGVFFYFKKKVIEELFVVCVVFDFMFFLILTFEKMKNIFKEDYKEIIVFS